MRVGQAVADEGVRRPRAAYGQVRQQHVAVVGENGRAWRVGIQAFTPVTERTIV
jgi:hypothetical protein